jgi:hypothetical protein
MNEEQWLSCTDPTPMLQFLRNTGKLSTRKARLFAVACCRRLWHLLPDRRSRWAVEAAELYADGAIDSEAFKRACEGVNQPRSVVRYLQWPDAWMVADFVSFGTAGLASDASGEETAYSEERQAQCGQVLEHFGNPFRPVSVRASCLKANKGRVRKIAQEVYAERAFDRLPDLAQALEAAGCTEARLLCHLRSAGHHVRGCFAVDIVTGRE